MSPSDSREPIASAVAAATTNKTPHSLVRCEVQLDRGAWVTPRSCEFFYITGEAKLPEIDFEIETSAPGPYDWSWEVRWIVMACPQRRGRPRFKPRVAKTYAKVGSFQSHSKKWKADLGEVVGGELRVSVTVGTETFVRHVQILGTEPGKSSVDLELEKYSITHPNEAAIARKIFEQESNYSHFYSDRMPLVSFDNGYGVGQATNPPPSYEQAWNWKEHVKYIVLTVIREKRSFAKKYLARHGNYTAEHLDTETLVYYNGANAHYYVWNEATAKWIVNQNILCDPRQSNSGWDMRKDSNRGRSLSELREGKGTKPVYTGRCYAEHVKNK